MRALHQRPSTHALHLGAFALATLLAFQNCGQQTTFSQEPDDQIVHAFGTCDGVSCSLTPLTSKPAVTTILLALGDESDSQLVINGASAQLLAETVIRYSTPVVNPKILLVHDANSESESPDDLGYVKSSLLARYNVTEINEPTAGLLAADIAGYDLVWLNNPGHPMAHAQTRDTLIAFAGGVVLQGDDMSQGTGFSIETLTGLHFIDNGTSITCSANTYNTDNNLGASFTVNLDATSFTGATSAPLSFTYGNDIDNTQSARPDLQVLATAHGTPSDCGQTRPTIVRYAKP